MRIDSAPRSGTSPLPESQEAASEAARRPTLGAADASIPDATVEGEDGAPLSAGAPPKPARPQLALTRRARLWWTLGIAAVILLFLFAVRDVIKPFIWAGVIAYILNPLVLLLQRRLGLHRGMSASIIMLALLGLLVWGVSAAIPALRSDFSALSNSLAGINAYVSTYLPNAGTTTILGIPIQAAQIIHNAQTTITDLPHQVLHSGWSVASGAVNTLLRFLTFLISTFYLLLDGPRLRSWLMGRLPARYRDESLSVAQRINSVFREYLRAEVILILIMSVASAIALTLLGMRFALVLAPIVGFLEIFPIVGPFFAIALVALLALVTPPAFGLQHVGYAVLVALVLFVMRQIEDYLVIPAVVGHAVKLHPVLILFALLCGATVGGILGMFLAVPVTGAIKVLGGYAYDRLVG